MGEGELDFQVVSRGGGRKEKKVRNHCRADTLEM